MGWVASGLGLISGPLDVHPKLAGSVASPARTADPPLAGTAVPATARVDPMASAHSVAPPRRSSERTDLRWGNDLMPGLLRRLIRTSAGADASTSHDGEADSPTKAPIP